jgi:hypothetical protein
MAISGDIAQSNCQMVLTAFFCCSSMILVFRLYGCKSIRKSVNCVGKQPMNYFIGLGKPVSRGPIATCYINNVKKRLEFLYRGKYDLKLADEGEFLSCLYCWN